MSKHSPKFNLVKQWYEAGLWNKQLVKNAATKGWITAEEYEELHGNREDVQLDILKAQRAAAVASITVEVDGMVFDGDETAQERMSRTVTAAAATGANMDDTTTWVLHDNAVAQPSIRQLATALRLAGEKQTELWVRPYVE